MGSTLYGLDFFGGSPKTSGVHKVFQTKSSILSPIVKLNKVGSLSLSLITLDNQFVTLDLHPPYKVLRCDPQLKLAVNCLGLVKLSRFGQVYLGLGHANQCASDPKAVLYYYHQSSSSSSKGSSFVQDALEQAVEGQPPERHYSVAVNLFDLNFMISKRLTTINKVLQELCTAFFLLVGGSTTTQTTIFDPNLQPFLRRQQELALKEDHDQESGVL